MTGFAGRVHYEGDSDQREALVRVAMKHAEKLGAWKKTQGIDSVTKVFDLGDGSYVTIVDAKNMRAMHVVGPHTYSSTTGPEPYQNPVDNYHGIADVHSGRVDSPVIVEEVDPDASKPSGVGEPVKYPVLRKFTATAGTSSRFTDFERRRRLAVQEDPIFTPIGTNPEIIYSEHSHAKPSMYTGAMRKVVQLILGMGVAARPTWEEKWMLKNKKAPIPLNLRDFKTGKPKPDTESAFGLYRNYNPTAPIETKLRFFYAAARTHGVTFDSDGVPWVIEISNRGVHAMRLYLDPVSTTKEGRERYARIYPELEEFLDEFGGIPLGTPFPPAKIFDKWKKAGEVVELVSKDRMDEFYGKLMYSSAMGWSFNSRGTQAHNTCYGYDQAGLIKGYHYKVDIKVTGEKFKKLEGARGQLYGTLTNWLDKQKCLRMEDSDAKEILSILRNGGGKAARAAFDEITVTPTLKGSAYLTMVKSGTLYHPARFKSQPQIKFPEPMLGGLLSFDFTPAEKGAKATQCDMTMFVCHIGDSLETVSYSYDHRDRKTPEATNTREECQFTGVWEIYTPAGEPIMYGNFYSSRWDFREEIPQKETKSTYSGRKGQVFGHASVPDFFSRCVNVWASVAFIITSKNKTVSGRSVGSSVAIPMNDRNCYYMAKWETISGTTSSEGMHTESTGGAQVQDWHLYNFVFHWFGGCGGGNINSGSIKCIAKKTNDVQVDSCVTDQIPGEIYYAVCPEAFYANTKLTVVAPLWDNAVLGSASWPESTLPTPYNNDIEADVAEASYEIRMINDSGLGEITTEKEKKRGKNEEDTPVGLFDLKISSWWWTASPSEGGAMPWMGVTQSCLGSTVVNYHTDLDGHETKSRGSPATMHGSTLSCYTGVIK